MLIRYRLIRRFLAALLLLSFAPLSGGCALIGLPAFATVLGIASSAASIGGAVYSQGKLDSAEMTSLQNWTASVYAAADDMHLKIKSPGHPSATTQPGETVTIVMEDDLGSSITVTAERRTPTLLRNRVDVGVFGSEPTARLVLSNIRRHAGVTVVDQLSPAQK